MLSSHILGQNNKIFIPDFSPSPNPQYLDELADYVARLGGKVVRVRMSDEERFDFLRDWIMPLSDGTILVQAPIEKALRDDRGRYRIYKLADFQQGTHVPEFHFCASEEKGLIRRSVGESMPPSHTVLKRLFVRHFPEIARQAPKEVSLAGGNVIVVETSDKQAQIVLVGENIVLNAFALERVGEPAMSKEMRQDSYRAFKLRFHESLFGGLALREGRDKLFFVPQSSYHLDLDVVPIQPGVVALASYERIFKEPGLIESIQAITVLRTYRGGILREGESLQDIASSKEQVEYLRHRQLALDEISALLTENGIRVLRVFGNCPMASGEKTQRQDTRKDLSALKHMSEGIFASAECLYLSGTLQPFNFLNGISMLGKDGKYQYFCFATYDDFRKEMNAFSSALGELGVECHFLNAGDPTVNHIGLQYYKTGLRCFTMLAERREKECKVCSIVKETKTCSRCRRVYYCSQACQRKAWPVHKLECRQSEECQEGS